MNKNKSRMNKSYVLGWTKISLGWTVSDEHSDEQIERRDCRIRDGIQPHTVFICAIAAIFSNKQRNRGGHQCLWQAHCNPLQQRRRFNWVSHNPFEMSAEVIGGTRFLSWNWNRSEGHQCVWLRHCSDKRKRKEVLRDEGTTWKKV